MDTLFFRTPRLVALTILVILAAGASAFLAIGRQEDPTITNLFANVTTVYPGADPSRVEALVSEKIETELQEIPEIDVIESTSSTGISIVSIELVETLEGERIEQVWSEIRDALSDAARTFPAGVLEPEFDNDGTGAFASISALYPLNATTPESVTQRYAEELADVLRGVSGTKLVEIFGAAEEEVLVTVDFAELTALGLTVDQVAAAIRSADAKVQAGRVRTSGSEYLIEVQGEISALDRVRRIPLTSATNGAVALLGEIATVEKTPRTPATEIAYAQGERGLLVAARINDGLQVDAWMASVEARLAAFEDSLPYSLEHRLIFDQSAYTADRLVEVGTNMAIGMALVIAVLFLTLGVRAALIVAMVLPLVSMASIATMNFAGMAIHQMSVTGLIVALGLLVDAAIVMTDEVRQSLARGMERVAAVQKAVRRLAGDDRALLHAHGAAARARGGFRGLHRALRDHHAGLVAPDRGHGHPRHFGLGPAPGGRGGGLCQRHPRRRARPALPLDAHAGHAPSAQRGCLRACPAGHGLPQLPDPHRPVLPGRGAGPVLYRGGAAPRHRDHPHPGSRPAT